MSKTPEELCKEWAKENIDIATQAYCYGVVNQSFLAGYNEGYKDAQEHAHAELEEAEARHEAYVLAAEENFKQMEAKLDQLADAGKGMNSSNNSNGWISVDERLPKSHKAVMWYLKDNLMAVGSFDEKQRGVFVDAYFFKLKEFAHWMPLPEPPKEEK